MMHILLCGFLNIVCLMAWFRATRVGYPSHGPSSVVAFRNFEEEMKHPAVWESEQGGSSTTESSRDNLAALYRPPFAIMHQGSFEKVGFC